MSHRVELTDGARRALAGLPTDIQRRIVRRLKSLAADPRPAGTTKLAGWENTYRVREGAYRILYQVEDRRLLILVIKIGHRRDICR